MTRTCHKNVKIIMEIFDFFTLMVLFLKDMRYEKDFFS